MGAKFLLLVFFSLIVLSLVASETVPEGTRAFENDNDVLNFALVLEDLEANFYNAFLEEFDEEDFSEFPGVSRPYLELIRQHENAHVELLRSALSSRGVADEDIVSNCTYNFGAILKTIPAAIRAAATFENLGVSAYAGATYSLTDSTLLTSAVSIAEVEALHAAYLNLLVRKNPYPHTFDKAVTPQEAYSAALGFQTCLAGDIPLSWEFPVPADEFRDFDDAEEFEDEKPLPGSAAYVNDNNVLNFALFLEILELNFYSYVQKTFGNQLFDERYNGTVSAYFNLIRRQEKAHVAFVKSVLQSRETDYIVSACTYDFSSVQTLDDVITTSIALEATGAAAYAGQAASLTDSDLLMAAGTIATVESRHTSFLRALMRDVPFPSDLAPVFTVKEVTDAVDATGFVVSCPTNTEQLFGNLPVAADNFRPENDGDGEAPTTGPFDGEDFITGYPLSDDDLDEEVEPTSFYTAKILQTPGAFRAVPFYRSGPAQGKPQVQLNTLRVYLQAETGASAQCSAKIGAYIYNSTQFSLPDSNSLVRARYDKVIVVAQSAAQTVATASNGYYDFELGVTIGSAQVLNGLAEINLFWIECVGSGTNQITLGSNDGAGSGAGDVVKIVKFSENRHIYKIRGESAGASGVFFAVYGEEILQA